MRVSIGTKIFGIAIALLLFMAAVFTLGQGMAREASRQLTTVVENYVPIYAAVSRANLRSVEESAALRGMWVILLDNSNDPLRGQLDAGIAGAAAEIAAQIAEARRLIAHSLVKVPDSSEAVLLARLDERLSQLSELATPYETMVKDGMLDMYLHTEKGVSMGAAPSPKLHPANGRPYDSLLYGRYSVRFRSEALKGFKTAWLLWPDSGVWPRDGEIDYPEGDLSASFYGAVHQAGSDMNIFQENQSGARFTAWHTATTEWTPGRVEFFLDGVSIGVNTSGIPDAPMHYILQTESCLTGCPSSATAGHLQVAWVAIWARA